MKSQPQWPHWGWNRLSCPCSWWQGLQDLRFQPISIGDTSFLSLGASSLSPRSHPPSFWSCLTCPFQGTLSPSPETPLPHSHSHHRHSGLSMSGLVAGWGLGSRQLCSFSSWRGGVCCSYGPWGELLEGWRVQNPWQFGMCVHKDLNPTFSGALCSSLSETSLGSTPSSGTRRMKPLVPIPSQLLPFSGPPFPDRSCNIRKLLTSLPAHILGIYD